MSKKIVFVIGGARSGKSSFAMNMANSYISSKKGVRGGDKVSPTLKKAYIATAQALDNEMKERIEKHKKQRGNNWDTYEEPLKLSMLIEKIGSTYNVIVLDCLTLWLSNLLMNNKDIEKEIESFCRSLSTVHSALGGSLFVVSNEVGMGIVPENEMARSFRDWAGILNQKIAEVADEVYMVVAGISVKIKNKGEDR